MRSARMCCTPWRTSSIVFNSFSGLSMPVRTSARLATAGSRFQIALAGRGGQAAFLRLVGEIEIFQAFRGIGGEDGSAQFIGQFPLSFDALENRLLAL